MVCGSEDGSDLLVQMAGWLVAALPVPNITPAAVVPRPQQVQQDKGNLFEFN